MRREAKSWKNQEVLNLVLTKLEKMEAKIDALETKFDNKFDKLEAKVNSLEITVKGIQEDTKITRSAVCKCTY